MKRIILYISLLSLALSSCVKQDFEGRRPSEMHKNRLTFVAKSFPDSKTSIGELQDGKYPVLWSAGDRLGLYSVGTEISVDDTEENGILLNDVAELVAESEGKNIGVFELLKDVTFDEATDLVMYYPYGQGSTFENNILKGVIRQEQTMPASDVSTNIGRWSFAWAKGTVPASVIEDGEIVQEPVEFVLNHANAYVKLILSTTEYSSCTLNSVSLFSKGAELAGNILLDTETGGFTVGDAKDYVNVSIENPKTFASAQEVWLTCLPADLTGKDVYVVVTMTDKDKNVTVPMKIVGKKLLAGAVNVIRVDNISAAANTFGWYEPEESRYLAGGWSYGEANTFMIAPDGSSRTISVKARGNFSGCQEPKFAKILYGCHLNANDFPIRINGKTNNAASPDYQEFVELSEDYSMDVTANAWGSREGYSGKIAIYNADKEMLWAFTIWGVAAVEEHQYKSAVVMDRNLGQGYAPDNDSGSHAGLYFQWGRPFCFSWPGGLFPKEATTATDLGVSASKADKFLFYQGVSNSGLDWYLGAQTGSRSDRKDDLWGNPNRTDGDEGSPEKGVKSIFDPCPKGWMVISPTVAKEVMNNVFEHRKGTNVRWVVYKYDGEHEALYPYTGCKWGETAGNSTNNINDIAGYWTNSPVTSYDGASNSASCMYFRYRDEQTTDIATTNGRANGFMVRCMKDDENR